MLAKNTEIRATVHNAKLCTVDGSDYWIGCLRGRGVFEVPGPDDCCDTKEGAIAWVVAEAARRGLAITAEDVVDTTSHEARAVP